jgi:TetR/AcrR family transcriptional repressor of nem operon
VPPDGAPTRERILEAATTLVVDRGFAATTVDAVLEAAGTTKGAFFHHFPSKASLGHALVERYAAVDVGMLEEFMASAEASRSDPAEQLVEFLRLFEDAAADLAHAHSGCLYVSFVQQSQLVDEHTIGVIAAAVLAWRERLEAKLGEAAAVHGLPGDVDLTSLADLAFTVFEGGFILARTLGDAELMRGQLAHLRRYVELLFGVQPRARTRTSEISVALPSGTSTTQTTT